MPWPDLVNALFQCLGGWIILLNVKCILHDKMVRGVDWRTLAFFTTWSAWNLYYYMHLSQWWSLAAGLLMLGSNALYLGLMIYYTKHEGGRQ